MQETFFMAKYTMPGDIMGYEHKILQVSQASPTNTWKS